MTRSMTGYGAARRAGPLGAISVEIRSVNNRFLDLAIRGLREAALAEYELRARQTIQRRVARGKVEVVFKWDRSGEASPRPRVNRELLSQLLDDLLPLARQLVTTPAQLLGPVASVPGALEMRLPDIDAARLEAEFDAALSEALDRFDDTRQKEGRALAGDLLARAATLRAQCQRIAAGKDAATQKYRERLGELAASLSAGAKAAVVPERLEAEVALYADRCDITEELVRLDAHLADLENKLRRDGDEAIGKSLEFLLQELLRETNTIGSKGRDTEIAQTVLQMKNEIEKIREQAQNIE